MIHPIIDACLDAARQGAIDAAEIERIELTVNPLAVQLCNRPEPKNRNQAMVSFQHWAAAAFIHKAAGIAEVTEERVRDSAIGALRRKVTAMSVAGVGREAASVRVVLKSGKAVEAEVKHCRGSEGRPLTDEDISDKTTGQLRVAFPADAAEQILAGCWRIEQCPRVDALSARFRRPQTTGSGLAS